MASLSSQPQFPAVSGRQVPELRWLRAVPALAFLLALAASVALLFLPFYGNVGVGGESTGTATLIEVNGSGVVVPLALPVLLTGVMALVRGRRSLLVSVLCTFALAAFVVLALASIGMFYVPSLVVAAVGVLSRMIVGGRRSRLENAA